MSLGMLFQRFNSTSFRVVRAFGADAWKSAADSLSARGTASTQGRGLRTLLLGGAAFFTYTFSHAEELKPNPYEKPTTVKGLPHNVVLYQYEVCPFCCKVKAFLDYNKIPYKVVEVNPLTKKELKWSQYKKVPVVLLDDEQINDSSAIISRLQAELDASKQSVQQQKPKQWLRSFSLFTKHESHPDSEASTAEEEEHWRRWVDDYFVRAITVNLYRSANESFQSFDYITTNGNFNFVERNAARVFGAGMMWAISGRLQKKYGVEGDLRAKLYDAANEWVEAVGPRKFLGGTQPDLADLAVFGVIRAIVGTNTFRDLMMNSSIAPWYDRMSTAVGESARILDDGNS